MEEYCILPILRKSLLNLIIQPTHILSISPCGSISMWDIIFRNYLCCFSTVGDPCPTHPRRPRPHWPRGWSLWEVHAPPIPEGHTPYWPGGWSRRVWRLLLTSRPEAGAFLGWCFSMWGIVSIRFSLLCWDDSKGCCFTRLSCQTYWRGLFEYIMFSK